MFIAATYLQGFVVLKPEFAGYIVRKPALSKCENSSRSCWWNITNQNLESILGMFELTDNQYLCIFANAVKYSTIKILTKYQLAPIRGLHSVQQVAKDPSLSNEYWSDILHLPGISSSFPRAMSVPTPLGPMTVPKEILID